MFRTYEIRGSHPEYKIPKPGGGRLDNKLTKDVESKLARGSVMGTKNFIVENIKKQKELELKTVERRSKRGLTIIDRDGDQEQREQSWQVQGHTGGKQVFRS